MIAMAVLFIIIVGALIQGSYLLAFTCWIGFSVVFVLLRLLATR